MTPDPRAGPPEPVAVPPVPVAVPPVPVAATPPPTVPPDPVDVLDCRGQRCPLPVIALARRLPQLPVGAVLRVLADDPAAAADIPAWCRLRRQEYLWVSTMDGIPAYDIRRAV